MLECKVVKTFANLFQLANVVASLLNGVNQSSTKFKMDVLKRDHSFTFKRGRKSGTKQP